MTEVIPIIKQSRCQEQTNKIENLLNSKLNQKRYKNKSQIAESDLPNNV